VEAVRDNVVYNVMITTSLRSDCYNIMNTFSILLVK